MLAKFLRERMTKAFWLTAWKNHLRWNLLILIVTFAVLLTIDLVSKGVVYDGNSSGATGPTQANWGLIAFRSQFHTSTTFFDAIRINVPRPAMLALNYLIVLVFCYFIFNSPRKARTLVLCVAFSGVLGNTIDLSAFGGVRNVLFLPNNDNGTFNFADFFIVLGFALIVLELLFEFIMPRFKKWRHKEHKAVVSDQTVLEERGVSTALPVASDQAKADQPAAAELDD